ncbi:MAG: redoxin domain-containing protein [Cyclobacteriaceae bacterium]
MRRIIVIAFASILFLGQAYRLLAQDPQGLQVNQVAPDFTAKDQSGNPVHLKSQLAKGSVVLVFYRGEWCPFAISI